MTLARLGENRRHLSVPCDHPLILGRLLKSSGHAKASVQVQVLRPQGRHGLPRVTQGF